jgi:hypothetical protein
MPLIDREQFGPQLKFWSVHVMLTAAPSFGLALMSFNSITAITAMLAGITTFVIGYTLLCSLTAYQKMSTDTVLGRAVKTGAKIRLIISLATAPLLLSFYFQVPLLFFAPDYWAGLAAIGIVQTISATVFQVPVDLMDGSSHFALTYCVVIVEGLLLSFTLVLLVFFTLLFLNRKVGRNKA